MIKMLTAFAAQVQITQNAMTHIKHPVALSVTGLTSHQRVKNDNVFRKFNSKYLVQ